MLWYLYTVILALHFGVILDDLSHFHFPYNLTQISGEMILITAPNVVHLGVQETISVQLHGATEAVDVTLYFRHLKNQPLSTRTTVNLNTNNQYQAVVTLTVHDYNRIKQKKDTGSNFVQLTAESKLFEAKPQLTNIYLSTRRGYIFIQTDKPIYNPGELVNFRIFTLDNYMKPIDDLIYVKITNSRGLMVYSHLLRSEQIFRRSVRIPDVELAGHWKITASYYNYGMSETSVEFEVREYVLPMFEVNIEATKPYLTLNSEFFPFSITARYTYGKGADGIAYVRFGLVDGKGERTYLPGIEKQIKVEDGRADYLLYTQDLLSAAANQSLQNIEGMYLYIAATVLEKASGDLEEAESSSVKIVNSPYVVDLSKTKKHFTPGGKFSILVCVLICQNWVSVEGGEEEVIISDANITSTATQPSKNCYLSVEVQHQVLQPGQNLQVTFRDITPPGTTRPSHIYYMVLSKGRVLMVGKVQRSDLTSTSLDFSEDMVPSFRLLAYYYTEGGSMGLVADSVWVDVKDVCKGKIEIVPFKDLKPAEEFEVLVRTDPDSSVALSAVDSAVYILNKRNKLSPQKMFDYMNSYDLACSVGGGEDSKSVLQRVGLTYISKHKCNKKEEKGHHQTKRDVDLNRKCCDDGRKLGLTLKSCDERLKKTRHQSESCRQAFKKCCEAAAARRKREKINSMKLSLGRGKYIHLYFCKTQICRFHYVTPDSITTWEVQAVAMSPSKGFCVADPKPLRVFQDFFVSVKLPYSVKRNEQLEVKAVVYNYKKEDLKVTLTADGLCSAGEGDVVQDVSVSGQSAVAVYFTVVPLIIGKIPINVLAYASPSAQDRIQKELRVVGEGELVSIYKEYNIDAKNVSGCASVGGVMGESVDNCLNLDGVDNLIKLPTGCAEQTMVKMSPALHAMKYLDGTNQWAFLKAERRDEAQSMIQAGYTTVLTFKKSDGSYGAFLTRPSSNWLTAFIAKEMTNSRSIIQVRDSYIQESMSYLISKQKAGGSWDDPNPLYDTGMKGGVGQTKDEAPLTAYILIAMTHAKQAYEQGTDTELITAMEKAKSYLVQNFARLQNPYAVTITAYALSLIGQTPQEAQQATRKMMEMATCDTKRCFWNVREAVSGLDSKADAISIEATAYGLLQAVSLKDKERALRIASWLTQQRKYGGGFQSTQDTVVALEALSKFSIQNNDVEDLDLRVELCINDKETKNLHLNKYNALTQAAVQVRGILQTYRSLKKEESHCDQFHFSVQVDGELVLKSSEEEEEQLDDYYNYESNDEELAKDEPMSREEWFDLRTRRKRQAPEQPKKENILVYTVCVGNSSGMVVVDISLLSGLTPIIQDLEDNVKGTEKYIDHYDFHHNKVFLYFDKLTEEKDCLRFRVEQIIPIGLIQPAAAVIYDYYNPDRRCSTFYTAPKSSPMLSKLCEGDVCMCAEGDKTIANKKNTAYFCIIRVVNYC
uniref:Complement component 4 n=1 Tax=Astyanax mexicanus TaxID=7994 RepID=A0A8B9H1D7_ASTMX